MGFIQYAPPADRLMSHNQPCLSDWAMLWQWLVSQSPVARIKRWLLTVRFVHHKHIMLIFLQYVSYHVSITCLSRTTVRDGVLPFLSTKPLDIKGDIGIFLAALVVSEPGKPKHHLFLTLPKSIPNTVGRDPSKTPSKLTKLKYKSTKCLYYRSLFLLMPAQELSLTSPRPGAPH